MVGKTKLIRTTGSPLIGGMTRKNSPRAVYLIAGLVALVLAAAAVWYFLIR